MCDGLSSSQTECRCDPPVRNVSVRNASVRNASVRIRVSSFVKIMREAEKQPDKNLHYMPTADKNADSGRQEEEMRCMRHMDGVQSQPKSGMQVRRNQKRNPFLNIPCRTGSGSRFRGG